MNKHRKRVCRLAAEISALLAAGALSGPVLAQQAVSTLAPVKVQGQAQPAEANPVQVEQSRLAQTQARDLREAVAGQAGVEVGGGGAAIAQKIYVRGVEENLLNVTLDGARQNGFIFHHQGRNLIDPQLLKRVEITKGTPTAVAGPGALAGSISMSTKDARDLLREGQSLGGMLGGGLSSNAGWRSNLGVYGIAAEGLDFLAWGSTQKQRSYRDGQGKLMSDTGSEQDNSLFKAGWDFLPGQRLAVSHVKVADEGKRYLRPHMVAFSAANSTPLPSKFSRETSTVKWTAEASGKLPAVELSTYRDDNSYMRTVSGREHGEEVITSGTDALLTSRIGNHKLEYGLNYVSAESAAINPANVRRASYVNGATNSGMESSETLGVFLQDALSLGEHWLLGAGTRYDRYEYRDNHAQTFKANGFSPNTSLSFLPTDASSIRLGYAEALRGAGLKEAYMLDNGPGPRIYKNDAELKEERARNLELSADHRGQNWGVRGAVYSQTVSDYIDINYDGGKVRRSNMGTLKNRGWELGGDWSLNDTRLGLSVAHSKPKLNGQPLNDANFGLGVATGRSWKLGLNQDLKRWNLELGWDARYVEGHDTVAADNAALAYRKSGYVVHDLSASWLPLGQDRLAVRFAIKNVFDRDYYDQSTYAYNAANNQYLGMAEPGRDLRVDVSYKF